MSVSSTGEGSRPKGVKAAAATTTPKVLKTPAAIFKSPSSSQTTEDLKDKVLDPTKNTTDGKPPPRYNAMIPEALSNIKEPNGADIGAMNDFIEQRHEVPSNSRRLLSSKLRRLVAQDKLEKLVEQFDIDPNNAFAFWDWVGDRYSVCSAVGVLPLSLQYGLPLVEKFLKGASIIDKHFNSAPFEKNMHVIMESNRNGVSIDGVLLPFEVGEIDFGEPGTNDQHNFYQLIHQGRVIPCDFIGVVKSQQPVYLKGEVVSNHDELMSNFFAQPDALAYRK
ncbi:hypothetical protein MKX01_036532, partial [Papaver californicum]